MTARLFAHISTGVAALRRRLVCAPIAVSLLLICTSANALDITIEGVSDDIADDMRLHIGQPATDTRAAITAFGNSIPETANRALQAAGYYSARYVIAYTGTAEEPGMTITVKPGEPVRISSLAISITGDARLDAGYMPVIGRIPVRRNGVFTHADYESTKNVLFDAAQNRGYFDFKFTTSTVRISREKASADIALAASSGERYRFGEVTFSTDYFTDELLTRYLPFAAGDYYESAKLATLTRDLQTTGFFESVKVLPIRDQIADGVIPVRVTVTRRDKNYIGLGVGFATDTEWRTKVTWSKPTLNTAGHSFDSALELSQVEQNISFQLRIPRKKNPLTNYWSLEYGLQNLEVDETRSFLSTLNLQRVRQTSNGWRESQFIRWERERSTIGGIEDETDLVLPGIAWSKNKSTGLPFPTDGYSASVQFMYGSRYLLSDIDFYKSTLNYKWLKTLGKRNTFIVALQYGAISTNDFTRVPASQRFFAGGDRSIRGFDYRSVSPRNPEGLTVGGRYLEVTSLEYNYRIRERWAVALFADAGRAFNRFDQSYSVGAGVGVRWYSPVGPFRIDIASDVSEDDPGFSLHLSLGPDL